MKTNAQIFSETYLAALADSVRDYQSEYGWPVTQVPVVHAKMMVAVERGTFCHDSRAFKLTCKRLGIKNTRKAMLEFYHTPAPVALAA